MKKKIITIVAGSVSVILISALIAAGILMFVRQNNVKETGNVLGVTWYNEYDEEFTIDSVEELYEFARLSNFYDFKGQTVKLGADLVVNEGSATDWADDAPKTKWTPISDFAGTFDGQGHSISGVYGKTFESPLALFINTNSKCVIQDLKLLNSYFKTSGSAGVASFATGGDGKFEKLYSDTIIDCKGEISGGILGTVKAKATINECWFDGIITQTGRKMGGIVGVFLGGRSTMNNCLFTGKISTSQTVFSWDTVDGPLVGGMCGLVNTDAGAVMKDCLATGEIVAEHKTFTGGIVGRLMSGGQLNVTNVYNAVVFEDRAHVSVGGSYGTQVGNPIRIDSKLLDGTKAYQWTFLDYQNYWSCVENTTPVLKYFSENILDTTGVEKAYDVSWYDANAYEFVLSDLKDLLGFAIMAQQNNFQNCIIKLAADIVVNEGKATDWAKGKNLPENPWFKIGQIDYAFEGTFDGQGHTISGIYLKDNSEATGMFGRVNQAGKLQNFKLVNTYIDATGNLELRRVAGVVGACFTSLDTIYTDAIVHCDGSDVGGLAGFVSIWDKTGIKPVIVNNCWSNSTVYGKSIRRASSFIGNVTYEVDTPEDKRKVTLTNCLNTGTVGSGRKNNDDELGDAIIGGLVGYVWGGFTLEAKDCVNVGTVNVEFHNSVGSFFGAMTGNGHQILENCITTKDSYQYQGTPRAYTGGSVANRIGDVMVVDKKTITEYNAYKYTLLDFDKYWGVAKSSTPVLKSFANNTLSVNNIEKMIDVSWYKESAKKFVLEDAKDFYGFSVLALGKTFKGQTIQLAKDIDINPGWQAGADAPQVPYYSVRSFEGTLDGQGHTLKGVHIIGGSQDAVGLIATLQECGKIKNLVLDNSYIESQGNIENNVGWYTGGIVGMNYGNIDGVYIKDGVYVKSNMPYCGGIVGNWRGNGKIENCWFDGTVEHNDAKNRGATGGIVGGVSNAKEKTTDVTMENCLSSGTVIGYSWDIGGLLGGTLAADKLSLIIRMKNCLNVGKVESRKVDNYVGSVLGGLEQVASSVYFENVYTTDDITTPNGNINTDNGLAGIGRVKENKVYGISAQVPNVSLQGKRAYMNTNLDFWSNANPNGIWVATAQNPELKLFSKSSTIITDFTDAIRANVAWYDAKKVEGKIPKNTTFELKNESDYLGFIRLSSNGETFAGHTVKLLADIDLNPGWDASSMKAPDAEMSYISSSIGISVSFPFAGTFDGKGHTIKGVYIKGGETDAVGWITTLDEKGMVKNLILANSYIESSGDVKTDKGWYTGGIVGMCYGSIDGVYVKDNVYVKSNMPYCGGIVGNWRGNGKIENCWFDGTVEHNDAKNRGATGGIVGGVSNAKEKTTDVTMENCLSSGTVIGYSWDIGGLLGGTLAADKLPLIIRMKNCVNTSNVDSKVVDNYVGTVVGGLEQIESEIYFENIYTTDSITTVSEKLQTDNGFAGVGRIKTAAVRGTTTGVSGKSLQGKRAYMDTELDFWSNKNPKGVWAVSASGVMLKRFSGSASVINDFTGVLRANIDWYNEILVDGKVPKNTTFKLETPSDYLGFVRLVNNGIESFKGHTVKLMVDINLNPDWDASTMEEPNTELAFVSNPIGMNPTYSFEGTFDGGFHTIQGVYIKQTADNTGLFGVVKNGLVKNLIIANSCIRGAWFTGTVVGELAGESSVDYVYVQSSVYTTSENCCMGGIVGKANTNGQITRSWFAGNLITNYVDCGGLIGRIDKAATDKAIIKDCLYTGTITAWENRVGGLIGCSKVNVKIQNCVVGGTIHARWASRLGSVYGAALDEGVTAEINNVYSYIQFNEMDAMGTIIGTRPESTVASGTLTRRASDLQGIGAYRNTKLDLYWKTNNDEGIWVATEVGPILRKFVTTESITDDFAGVIKVSFDWYKSGVDTYYISSKEELIGFNELANSGTSFTGKTIILTQDIALNEGNASDWADETKAPEIAWEPLFRLSGTSIIPWTNSDMIFDGNGHTISGLYIVGTDKNNLGFFGYMNDNGIVRNLTITNSFICNKNEDCNNNTGYNVGTVVGNLWGKVENCHVTQDVTVKNANNNTGEIAGIIKGQGLITDSSFEGFLDPTTPHDWYNTSESTYYIGTREELLVFNQYANSGTSFNGKTVILTNDIKLNKGDATEWSDEDKAPETAWEPLFRVSGTSTIAWGNSDMVFDGNGHTISGLYIVETDKNNLGFFGYMNDNGIVKNLTIANSYIHSQDVDYATSKKQNTGDSVGAIVGNLWGKVENCHVKQNVTIKNENCFTGGLVGTIKGNAKVLQSTFAGLCDMSLSENGRGGCGGIVGSFASSNGLVENCRVTGTVIEGLYSVGGIVGVAYEQTNCKITIKDSCFNGKIRVNSNRKWAGLIICGVDGGSGNTIILNNVSADGKAYLKSNNSEITLNASGTHPYVGNVPSGHTLEIK